MFGIDINPVLTVARLMIDTSLMLQAWPHEVQDLMPWRLANADVLGEARGMELELWEAEYGVGIFSLNVIGVDVATNERVIMENQ